MMGIEKLVDAGVSNLEFIEELYNLYLEDPTSVDPVWQQRFSDFAQLSEKKEESQVQNPVSQPKTFAESPRPAPEPPEPKEVKVIVKEPPIIKTVHVSGKGDLRIYNLINSYRTYGHLMADLNPIAIYPRKEPKELMLDVLGFKNKELKEFFPTCGLLEKEKAPLQEIITVLWEIYCDKVGVEYMGLQNPALEVWLQEKIEASRFKPELSIDEKQMILQHLNKSELFEAFIHTKYVGQKRFSLEGGETLIPILAGIIDKGEKLGIEEFVIGMAHRGRLNVLANILEKSYTEIFSEFEEGYISESVEGSGDVKYHKGFSSNIKTASGKEIKVSLASNPSHLEAVDPVIEGQVRAKQLERGDDPEVMKRVVPIVIHGDAALSGQGVIYEVMQMSKLAGYETGGTIHLVINNQIGFTTTPKDSRSTHYCTDIAKAFGAPVFHVNAEHPEDCLYATQLAVEIRQKFGCDVFIDIYCYRKYGHNEGDEPAFTQPLEYKVIRRKKALREIYRDALIQHGVLEKYMAETLEAEFKKALNRSLKSAKSQSAPVSGNEALGEKTAEEKALKHVEKKGEKLFYPIKTDYPLEQIQQVAENICRVPKGFNIHPKLARLITQRLKMVKQGDEGTTMDWGMAENLAYATLLWDGKHVRLSGQDCRRGTFSHRHAMWVDQARQRKYFPLSQMKKEQGRFDVFNSPLSEYGVLGFEFGYSLANPEALVIWEAQFGDFANGAQIVIDQFISTAEQKWGKTGGVVLLLPHGYEGQGPEHSSARMERFLLLAGNYNMQICNPTTPAQLFHMLRRQALSPLKKPLVVFTPKGLLRHPLCKSSIDELATGGFEEILDDPTKPENPSRIVLCCGRVYYDLIQEREKSGVKNLAIIRIEQLYPLHFNKLKEILDNYQGFRECLWVQEEPSNMGAWHYIHTRLSEVLPEGMEPKYIGRAPGASPAAGSLTLHKKEHTLLMNAVFKAEEQPFYEMTYDQIVRG